MLKKKNDDANALKSVVEVREMLLYYNASIFQTTKQHVSCKLTLETLAAVRLKNGAV